jgi:hypothetical protein
MTEQNTDSDIASQVTDEDPESGLIGSWSEVTDQLDPPRGSVRAEPKPSAGPAGVKEGPSPTAKATAAPAPARPGSADKQRAKQNPDPFAGLQRWLIRSSARSMRREIEGQVRKTFSGKREEPGNVWDVVTHEEPPELGQSPECAWCPICQAARRMRESGPGLGSQLSGAGDAVAAAVQSAISAFEAAVGRPASTSQSQPRTEARPPADAADETGHDPEESAHEPDHRG